MNKLISFAQRLSIPLLRISLGIVLLWIGALKFVDPSPVVGLINASIFSFLAFNGFVYILGVVEVVIAILLFTGRQLEYTGLLLIALFGGTLIIFLTAPGPVYGEAGFPFLALPGEFLLKDLVLMSAALVLITAGSMSTAAKTA